MLDIVDFNKMFHKWLTLLVVWITRQMKITYINKYVINKIRSDKYVNVLNGLCLVLSAGTEGGQR